MESVASPLNSQPPRKYVPTAAIGLFGFVVGKGTLVHYKVDKEDAETFWIKAW